MSIECNENDGGSNSRTFLTQLKVCIVEVKFANDDEPAAIILSIQMRETKHYFLWKSTWDWLSVNHKWVVQTLAYTTPKETIVMGHHFDDIVSCKKVVSLFVMERSLNSNVNMSTGNMEYK